MNRSNAVDPQYDQGKTFPQPAMPGTASHVIVNVPVVAQPLDQNTLRVVHNLQGHRDWTSGLCDCGQNVSNCKYYKYTIFRCKHHSVLYELSLILISN